MRMQHKQIWLGLAIVFAALTTYLVLPLLVTQPGYIDMELGGDSSKNLFTFLYHSMYGNGLWFKGMNYPYGEHITYVDGQPVLSVTLASLRDTIHFTREQLLGIMHGLIAFSFFLAIVYTYKILREFNVKPVLSIVFSIFIITMSPQIFRVFGHFGLSYFCIIPMIFLWTIKYHKTSYLRYPVFIFITGIIASFLHPYFGAVVLIWAGFYVAGYYLFTKTSYKQKLKHAWPLLASVITVFAFIKIVVALTDPVTDRPVTPIGVLENGTTGEDIFFSYLSPIWEFINANIYGVERRTFNEGYVYIGFVATIILIIVFLSAIANRVLKAKKNNKVAEPEHFHRIWLFIAFAALLLGMGVPFIWHMQWLLDYITVFKQFRSLGRFSWMFYYVITVFAAVSINYWLLKNWEKRKGVAISGLASCLILWGIDCYGYIDYARNGVFRGPNNYKAFFYNENWTNFLTRHNHIKDDFQAILLLPFYHIGTEKFTLNTDQDWAMTLCMRTSLQLELPLVDAMMSRSSWSQAAAQARLVGGPFTDKPILHVSNKPFLLLCNNQTHTPLERNAAYLLQASDFIDSFSIFKVYACYPDRIKKLDQRVADSINVYYQSMQPGDSCFGCEQPYFVNHFDSATSDNTLFGSGAANVIKADEAYVADFKFETPLAADYEYEFSSWVLVKKEDYKIPYFILDVFDSSGGIIVRQAIEFKPVDNYGLWFRLANFFNLPKGTSNVKCMIVNKDGPTYSMLDELLLMPANNATVVSKLPDGKAMVNNHIFKK